MKNFYNQLIILFFVFSLGLIIFDKLIMPFYVRENLDRNLPNVKGYSFLRAKEKLESSTQKGRDALLAAKRNGVLEDIFNRMQTTSV